MRRLLPILAAAALLAAARAAAAPRRAPRPAIAPAHGFAPRQLVVKFDGERARRGRWRCRAGAGVREAARGAAPQPARRLRRARTTSPPPRRPTPDIVDPQRPRHPRRRRRSRAAPAAGSSSSGTSSPWEGAGDAAAADLPRRHRRGRRLAQPRRKSGGPGAEGVTVAVLDTGIAYRDQGSRFRRSPDFAAGQFVKGYDFVDNDRLPLDENGHGTHVAGTIGEKTNNGDRPHRARLPGEADAGAGARHARPRPAPTTSPRGSASPSPTAPR